MKLKFIWPDFYLWEEYADLLDEYTDGGPWTLFREYATAEEFEQVIHRTNRAALGIGVGEHAPCVTYWVRDVDTGRLVGAVNIRYYLTKQGFETWGHIGYGVRPSERRKGCATAILRMALEPPDEDGARAHRLQGRQRGLLEDHREVRRRAGKPRARD
jgi:predicted acetyltransferase